MFKFMLMKIVSIKFFNGIFIGKFEIIYKVILSCLILKVNNMVFIFFLYFLIV